MEPSVFFRLVSPVPASLDINSKFIFKESFWLGISYRTSDAVVLMAGLRIAEKFHFGYSYDITTSILNEYSRGSHEVMVGFDLYKKNRKNSRRLLNSSPMFL